MQIVGKIARAKIFYLCINKCNKIKLYERNNSVFGATIRDFFLRQDVICSSFFTPPLVEMAETASSLRKADKPFPRIVTEINEYYPEQ